MSTSANRQTGSRPVGTEADTARTGPSAALSPAQLARLQRKRSLVRAVLWFEQLWPAAWPALGVAAGYAVAALLGIVALLPSMMRFLLMLLLPAVGALLLWRDLRRVRAPGLQAVDRRLEAASGLRHQPLLVLSDRPAIPGATGIEAPAGDAVWRAHVGRAVAQIGSLRVGWPRPDLAAQDVRALRGLLAASLAASLVIAGPDALPRLVAAFTPGLPVGPSTPAPVLQAWITPPPSTGIAPVFLRPGANTDTVSIPAGSRLQISLTGGSAAPTLSLGQAPLPFPALDPTSWQAERVLSQGGRLSVTRGRSEIAAWLLAVVPDEAPVVAWAEIPGPDGKGTTARDTRTRLPWQVSHRYGVASLAAELRLDARPDDAPAIVSLPLSGAPKQAHGVTAPDLTAHPWAGLSVTAMLVGRDGQGLAGRSDPARFTLPERVFENPLARALIAARRKLTLAPEHRDIVVADLQALEAAPRTSDNNWGTYLGLSTIISLLDQESAPADSVTQAQARLWEMALALDAAAPERSARLAEQAREQVRQQLEDMRRDPAKQADPKQQAELKARVAAMQDAIKQHLEALLEQARKDGTLQPQDPEAQHQDSRDLDRLMQEMQDAAKDGRMDEAQQKMEELQKQMQALDDAAAQASQQARGKQPGKPGEERAQTAKDAVQDLLKREGGLLDRAQTRDRNQPGETTPDDQDGDQDGPSTNRDGQEAHEPGSPHEDERAGNSGETAPPPAAMQGQPGGKGGKGQQAGQGSGQAGMKPLSSPPSPADKEGRTQRAMRRALGELMQQFGDTAGSVPKSLGDADQAMQQAETALRGGRDSEAREAEQRAVADLRKGGQEMGQTMQRQFGLSDSKDGKDGQPGKGDASQEGEGEGGTGNKPGQTGRSQKVQRDPLGRLTQDGGHGVSDGDDVHVPDQIEQARSRDIQDELRRRGADRARPQPELDYIGRLLKPF